MKRHFVKESKVSKFIAIIMVMALVASLAGCRGADPAPAAPPTAPAQDTTAAVTDAVDEAVNGNGAGMAEVGDWRIGIITGTVSQGEEEYLAAMNMQEYFGADRISRLTYPDNFGAEMEVTIANILSLADAGAQAIVVVQAVPGTIAAINATREQFGDDIFFFAGVTHEPPAEIAAHADIALISDDLSMGRVIVEQAVAMGADTFAHISFPRHLAMENIAARHALLRETAEQYGLEWVELTAPDPMSEGAAAAQMFIIENLPRWVEDNGPNTAFFSTNCAMQEAIMTQIAAYGGLFPLQCCPSPFHALPAAFNVSMEGREGDVAFLLQQLDAAVGDAGASGRFSTWPVPINMLFVETGVRYSIEFLEGRVGRHDRAALTRIINEVANSFGVPAEIELSNWPHDGGYLDNMYRVLSGFVNF